jgi:hypothetical protein
LGGGERVTPPIWPLIIDDATDVTPDRTVDDSKVAHGITVTVLVDMDAAVVAHTGGVGTDDLTLCPLSSPATYPAVCTLM